MNDKKEYKAIDHDKLNEHLEKHRLNGQLEMLAGIIFSKTTADEGLFPNHTDKDIWVQGFKEGVAAITKAIVGEYSTVTQEWVLSKLRNYIKSK